MLNLHIQYPPAAREKGIEGRMELTFTVDRDGDTRNIIVSESLHPLCDSAAVDALRSVRFRPATYKGTNIPVRMSLPIRFQLEPTPPPTNGAPSSDR
jgi:TonB family protein